MKGYIAFYRGTSLISRIIRKFTWGEFSHVAYMFEDGRVIEAWHRGGVQERKSYHDGHTAGTRIERYQIEGMTVMQEELFVQALRHEIGCKYDLKGIVGFIRRRAINDMNKWFCSELIMQKLKDVGIEFLLRIKPYQTSPTELNVSPLLELVDIVVV